MIASRFAEENDAKRLGKARHRQPADQCQTGDQREQRDGGFAAGRDAALERAQENQKFADKTVQRRQS